MNPPILAWTGITMTIGGAGLIDAATQGGTLGGQALLFAAVVILGWVVVALFKSISRNNIDLVSTISTAATLQREEDRKHHAELVEAFRSERSTNIAERGTNFATLLAIARDSAAALAAATHAVTDATTVSRETAAAIRDLSVSFRELRISTHDDALLAAQTLAVAPPAN